MLVENALRRKMENGTPVFGLLNSLPSPLVCEMLAYAGYDFVIIDTEHQLLSAEGLQQCLRAAAAAGICAWVRVPLCEPQMMARALDFGAQGIVVPRVRSRAEAEAAVAAVRFPPQGTRGITGGRVTGFGRLGIDDYMTRANRAVMLVLMVEDPLGLAALPDMLTLPGIDMVLEGALDLSIAMGYGSQVGHPAVQAALRTMARHCAEAEVPYCAIPRQPGQLAAWCDAGVRAFVLGEDRGIIFRQLRDYLAAQKAQLPNLPKPDAAAGAIVGELRRRGAAV